MFESVLQIPRQVAWLADTKTTEPSSRHDYGFKALMVPWLLIKNRKMFHDYCAAMHDAGLVDMRNVNKN